MRSTLKKILPILILLIAFDSVNQWSQIQFGNTSTVLALRIVTIICVFLYFGITAKSYEGSAYILIKLYLIWLFFGILRGAFTADNYWVWKDLFFGTFALSLPALVFPFSNIILLHKILRIWIKYALPLFFIFFIWIISSGASHYYLGPLLLLACFTPVFNPKWQLVFWACIIILLVSDLAARSQVMKGVFALLICLTMLLRRFISEGLLKTIHLAFYLIPILLLILGLTGTFNVFTDISTGKKQFVQKQVVNGKVVEESLTNDTRTFIYVEVTASAIKHNYVLWGRTPARGNDSRIFWKQIAESTGGAVRERHSNEVCFPNVFTWLGLIGMLLYCSIYAASSYLSLYKSNSYYMKLIGIFIAFHFALGWIEDFNRLDISNISLWMAIAMGFSAGFRKMTNLEFKMWLKTLLFSANPQSKLIYFLSSSRSRINMLQKKNRTSFSTQYSHHKLN